MAGEDKVAMVTTSLATDLPLFIFNLAPIGAQLSLARQAIDELRQSHPDSTPSNVHAVYMSPWKSHRLNAKLSPLCASVLTVAGMAAKSISGFDLETLNLQLHVTDCWGAIYEQADYTAPHNHFPSDLACVIYLEAEDGCAPLRFAGGASYQPRPNTMVIFPGILVHEVPPTPGRRVVVAMNLSKLPRPNEG